MRHEEPLAACPKSAAQSQTTQSLHLIFVHLIPTGLSTCHDLRCALFHLTRSRVRDNPPPTPHEWLWPHPKSVPRAYPCPTACLSGSDRLREVRIHSSSAGRSAGATVPSSCSIACRAALNSMLQQKAALGRCAPRTRKRRPVATTDPPPQAAAALSPAPASEFSRARGIPTLQRALSSHHSP